MDKQLRIYTRKRLKPNPFSKIFRKISLTNWLIIVNFLVFILIYIAMGFFGQDQVVNFMALQPNNFFSGKVWTLLTSMFAHTASWHLLANMVSLFFIGNFTEKLIGRKRFFWLYLLSGLFAGLFYVTLSFFFGYGFAARIFLSPDVYAVGASGAIFALLGLLAIMTPFNKVYLISGPLFALIIYYTFSAIFPTAPFLQVLNLIAFIYIIFSILIIFSFNPRLVKLAIPIEMPFWVLPLIAIIPLIIIGLFVPLPIGNTAHLGGLIAGLAYAQYLRKKYKKKTNMIRKYFR